MTHLDLGGEVLHDGADELGFVGGEGDGGVGAGSGGVVSVFHDGSVSGGNGFGVFGSCVVFWLLVWSVDGVGV